MRLKGAAFIKGLFTFYAVCLVGAIGNIGVGEMIYDLDNRWWLGGLAGAMVGVVWNYAVSSVFTWRRNQCRPCSRRRACRRAAAATPPGLRRPSFWSRRPQRCVGFILALPLLPWTGNPILWVENVY